MSKAGFFPQTSQSDASVCPACGTGLRCGMVTGDSICWCYDVPQVIPVPCSAGASNGLPSPVCLCQNCLKTLIANHALQPSSH